VIGDILPAAIAAGAVAILVTVLIERYGGVVGGALGTVPTTIVPAVAGMASAQGDAGLMESLSVVPAGMLVNAIFLSVWIFLPPRLEGLSPSRSLALTTVASLAVWGVVGTIAVLAIGDAHVSGSSPRSVAVAGVLMTAAFGLLLGWSPREAPPGSEGVSAPVLLARGAMAASAIGASVWVAGLGYPLVAGLASVFPAIFLTSMVALWVSQGPSVPRGAAAPMLLGGGSVGVYALVAMTTVTEHGMVMGSMAAWAVAVLGWSLPSYAFLNWRSGASAPHD
jgi:hypothetical protein